MQWTNRPWRQPSAISQSVDANAIIINSITITPQINAMTCGLGVEGEAGRGHHHIVLGGVFNISLLLLLSLLLRSNCEIFRRARCCRCSCRWARAWRTWNETNQKEKNNKLVYYTQLYAHYLFLYCIAITINILTIYGLLVGNTPPVSKKKAHKNLSHCNVLFFWSPVSNYFNCFVNNWVMSSSIVGHKIETQWRHKSHLFVNEENCRILCSQFLLTIFRIIIIQGLLFMAF